MKKYVISKDSYVKVWMRETYSIEAKNKQDLYNKIKEGVLEEQYYPIDSEVYWESMEVEPPTNKATEIYYDEHGEILYENQEIN